jgi:hypothetical protein
VRASRLTSAPTATSPEGRLTAALELLGEAYSVRLPEPDDSGGVIVFLAEVVYMLALECKTLSPTRPGRRASVKDLKRPVRSARQLRSWPDRQ